MKSLISGCQLASRSVRRVPVWEKSAALTRALLLGAALVSCDGASDTTSGGAATTAPAGGGGQGGQGASAAGGAGGVAGGGAGSGGQTQSGGSAGSGGAGAFGGAGGQGGMSSGGAGGQGGGQGGMSSGGGGAGGGSCQPVAGTGCAACLSNACCPEVDACNASDNCRKCITMQPDSAACDEDPLAVAFVTCVKSACEADCLSCAGVLGGLCGTCAQDHCCAEVAACKGDPECIQCISGAPGSPGCAGNAAATAALACLGASCGAECSDQPRGGGCDAPAMAPSGGACVVLGGAVMCNPVTNEGCDSLLGETCDRAGGGFACQPAPWNKGLCESCAMGDRCGPGLVCSGDGRCARYCCADADCGTGTCEKGWVPKGGGAIGVCREGAPPVLPASPHHCDWLGHEECEACCQGVYPSGAPALEAAAASCACGACSAECGDVCAGAPYEDGTEACKTCVGDAVLAGTCAFPSCDTEPDACKLQECALHCGH
ncbi:MAG: hypothetical protein R3F14_28330 [Polyangiaceae bacterium]